MDKAVNSRLLYQLSYRGSQLLIVIHTANFDKTRKLKMAEMLPLGCKRKRAISLFGITVTHWAAST